MFTLKLFRRNGDDKRISNLTVAVHRVVKHEIGDEVDGKFQAVEITAYKSDQNNDYDTYYIGKPSSGMVAYGKDDLHLDHGPNSWWGWGLLENWEGNTSEHYRPASYG